MLRSGMKSSAHCEGEQRVGKRGKVEVLGDISGVATGMGYSSAHTVTG